MAKGRQGFMLEAWKFSVYLIVPIFASVYYSQPQRQKEAADYWKFIQYPSNPNVNMKQKIEELAASQEQRMIYRDQLQTLHQRANEIENNNIADTTTTTQQDEKSSQQKSGGGWRRWLGLSSKS